MKNTMTEKQAILLLCYVVNASPVAFWRLLTAFDTALAALNTTVENWQTKKIDASHIERFTEYKAQGKPQAYLDCLQAVKAGEYAVLFYTDVHYPKQLTALVDKPPLLFVKGNAQLLSQAQVAVVGSRKPSQSARQIAEDFSQMLADEGVWITSGLAEGIDKHAHIGALKQGKGRTIAVLGNGINTCYPKQNMAVYQQVLAQGGVIVSEFLPHTPPLPQNFPRRNRIVSGLSLATLVVEAAIKSGSLITAGFAAEQGKLVFAVPSHIYNKQAQGCHHLIREGAILVESPQQIIDDINLPRRLHQDSTQAELFADNDVIIDTTEQHSQDMSSQPKQPPSQVQESKNDVANTPALPSHLAVLLSQLDWVGQDMDTLINHTKLDIATLSSQLMELELHGLVVQTGGLYVRCRQ